MPLLLACALLASSQDMAHRAKDWTLGPVVYQVFVDRFAEGIPMSRKRSAYAAPKVLRSWSDLPVAGHLDASLGVWSHELEFWGGDLPGVQSRLAYIQGLDADAVYLTPVFSALTNHKYDTQDYFRIAPEFGSMSDLNSLIRSVHARKMKLMLDGVFNHMGRTSPVFQSALSYSRSPHRRWFTFGAGLPGGYKAWAGVKNLPELNLENPAVRRYLWEGSDSVVQSYVRRGIDGWRLDVGFELGPKWLSGITQATHRAKPGAPVIAEISGYPADWFPEVDGVFDFYQMNVAERMMKGELSGGRASTMLDQAVRDAGIENLLRSWLLLDNHDTPRIADQEPDWNRRKLLFGLQFTLPGAPVVYYGSELGMTGAGDPANRAPMRWDLATPSNPTLAWVRRLTALRRTHPALRYGDVRFLSSERLLAFARVTDRVRDSVIVVVNPTSESVTETIPTRLGKLMSWGNLIDKIGGGRTVAVNGIIDVTVSPQSMLMLVPDVSSSAYRRVP
jgi:cyclomaltodextrinase